MDWWGYEVEPDEYKNVPVEINELKHLSQVIFLCIHLLLQYQLHYISLFLHLPNICTSIFQVSIPVKDLDQNTYVPIYVTVDGQKYIATVLSKNTPNWELDLVFGREFQISHGWTNGVVQFSGYSVDPKKVLMHNILIFM